MKITKYEISNTKKVQNLNFHTQSGFTLLFSVLISSMLLAIGISIFSTTLKDLLFSSSGRESQFAFYAADTGTECALFWDKKNGKLPTTTASILPDSETETLRCNGEDIAATWDLSELGANPPVVVFYLNKDNANPDKICAVVRVSKYNNDGVLNTVIESRGYNTCDTNNPRRIERGIRVTY